MVVLFALLILTLLGDNTTAHPQCLDGKPPFVPTTPLSFCTEYQNSGCCTRAQDQEIQNRYENITSSITSETCRDHMKDILCQTCSPYAAHLYGFEDTGVVSPLPGLCFPHCSRVHASCGAESLARLSTDGRFRASLNGASAFCSFVQLDDTDYCYPNLKTNPLLTESFVQQNSADSPDCMCLQKVAENHNLVTFIESHPDNDDLMYIGEQKGRVYLYERGRKRSRPFLDLSRDVVLTSFFGDERGLLSLAFHPDFTRNKRFYVIYVIKAGAGQTVRISSLVARSNYSARKRSEKVLLDIPQPYWNHNGGQLLFGDDGYLYITTGDGGSAGDPQNNSQNLNSLLGKVLRVDVSGKRNRYTSPLSNPFNGRNARNEIFAYGLRNPWRCSVDQGDPLTGTGKGRIFCSDVGQNKFEEIDIIESGGNYGWKTREGYQCFSNHADCGKISSEKLPIFAYPHSFGKSITGGYVYRGCDYPEYRGDYFYGDYTSGRMARITESAGSWTSSEINMCSSSTCTGNWVTTYPKGITTFGTNKQSDIFMSAASGTASATVYKLIMQPYRRTDPASCQQNQVSSRYQVSRPYSRKLPPPKVNFITKPVPTSMPYYIKTTTPPTTTTRKSGNDDIVERVLERYSRRQRHLYDVRQSSYQTTTAYTYTPRVWYKKVATTPLPATTKRPVKVTYSWQKWLDQRSTTPTRSWRYSATTKQPATTTPTKSYWPRNSITRTTAPSPAAETTTYSWRKYLATTTKRPVTESWARPSYQRTTPRPRQSKQRTTLKPRPSYQRTTPKTRPSYQRTTPKPRPSYQRTTPKPRSSYQRVNPKPRPTYSWQARTEPTTTRRYSWQRLTTPKPIYQPAPSTRRQYSWQRLTTVKPVTRALYTRYPRLTTRRIPRAWETTTSGYVRQFIRHQDLGIATEYPLPDYLRGGEHVNSNLQNERYDPYIENSRTSVLDSKYRIDLNSFLWL